MRGVGIDTSLGTGFDIYVVVAGAVVANVFERGWKFRNEIRVECAC